MREPTTGGIQGWMAPYVGGGDVVRGRKKHSAQTAQPPIRLVYPLKQWIEKMRPQYEAQRGALVDKFDVAGVDELDRRWNILLDAG
jgi:hypothetical protein